MTYDFHTRELKRALAQQRKITRLRLYTKDKTPKKTLQDFAKRSPDFLPPEILDMKLSKKKC